MTTAMQALGVMPRYYAQAKQFLYDRHRLDGATADELANVAEYLRHQDFRRHIEPYLEQKRRLIGDFFALQVSLHTKMPPELEKALAQWDEMIDSKALEFGYSSEAGYNFMYDTCEGGVTRVSPREPPESFTIHCDGPYFPGALEKLQKMLNAECSPDSDK